jgi:hypothetical protein
MQQRVDAYAPAPVGEASQEVLKSGNTMFSVAIETVYSLQVGGPS